MPRYKSQALAAEAEPAQEPQRSSGDAPKQANTPVTTSRTGAVAQPATLVSSSLVCFSDVAFYYYNRPPVGKEKPSEVREYFIGMISIGTCWISEGLWRFVWDDLSHPMRMKDFSSEQEMLAFIQAALKGKPE